MAEEERREAGEAAGAADVGEPQAEVAAPEADQGDMVVLRNQLEEERARAEKNLQSWQRAEADLANYRRRAEQERSELVKFANASLIGKLLPVMDDFERALGAIPLEASSESWLDGVRLIERKLRTILEQEGVTRIESVGEEFNPHVHEAVMAEDGEGDTEVVLDELQKGYRLHDRVLRPAMVKVGRRSGRGARGRHSDQSKDKER